MSKYCCDLELSKQLYVKGIVKDAENWHYQVTEIDASIQNANLTNHAKGVYGYCNPTTIRYVVEPKKDEIHMSLANVLKNIAYKIICPAPITDELLEKLPVEYEMNDSTYNIETSKFEASGGTVYYQAAFRAADDEIHDCVDTKAADVLAKMLLWLKDNDYLEEIK